jgi:iron(III) transport system permease protein
VGCLALLPIVYLVVRAGSAGSGVVADTVLRSRTFALVVRSLWLTAAVTVCATALGVGLAWLVEATRLPLRGMWRVVCALPLAVPTYVAGYAFVARFPTLAGFRGAWLVLTLYTYPYVFLPVSAAIRGLDATQGEVAQSLGMSPRRVLRAVTLPRLRPAVATGALLVALYALSDFGAVSLMRYPVFTRAIYASYQGSFDRTPAAILGCVLVLFTLVIVWAESRARGRRRYVSVASGAVRPASPVSLGRWRWPAVAGVAAVAVAALGVPAATLARWLAEGLSDPAAASETWAAASASATLAALGALATVTCAIPVGLLAARHRGLVPAFAERASYAGHALPGIVVALSLVFFATRYAPALYQRTPLVVFAYVVLFLPLAVAAVYARAAQAPVVLEDVGRSLGVAPWAVTRRVLAPLLAPGVGAGAALVFLTCLKELPATLLLRPTGLETLATRVWSSTANAQFAAAAPPAALLVLAGAVPAWLLTRRREEAR